jgi:3-methyladenine DNA glycosylase/8-oxoguanine DNA glycosylase
MLPVGAGSRIVTATRDWCILRAMHSRTATSEDILVPLRGPSGEPVDLWRTLVSHGFHELAPVTLDEQARTLSLTLRVPRGKPRRVTIEQGPRRNALVTTAGSSPSATTRASISEQVGRVLHLDHDLASFYAVASEDPELAWAATGAGRMLRSPTVWEDVIKTLCTTNCSWGLTVTMVRALVTTLGDLPMGSRDPLHSAFPTSEAMAERDEAFYREVVRSGYRAPSFVRLSNIVASGELDLEALGAASREDLPDAEVEEQLLALPGIGPYAAAHIMMTLGRNSRLILDSWTRPTYARLSGARRQPTDAQIQRRFRRYGPDAGLAFWLYVTQDWVP